MSVRYRMNKKLQRHLASAGLLLPGLTVQKGFIQLPVSQLKRVAIKSLQNEWEKPPPK